MDLSDLIDRHAAFTPDKIAIRFAGRTLTYAAFAARIAAAARALKSQLGIGRGDRVAILSTNHPDYLVLLYACARLGALLVPLNWRLAIPEQVFILSDVSVKALVVEESFAAVSPPLLEVLPDARVVGLDFAPAGGVSFEQILAAGTGDGRSSPLDLSCPLLVVYASGTTGRPKGAVLRQEALVWNAAMSQHMHALTSDDHVLTVLPFFHVGGLNVLTTPALQFGATVTIHPRFAPDAALTALGEDRPTLTVLVPATMQALIEHPRWQETDSSALRGHHRFHPGAAAAHRRRDRARHPGAAGLRLDRDLPDRDLHAGSAAIYSRGALHRPARPPLRGPPRRRGGPRGPARHARRGALCAGPNVFSEYWGNAAATARGAARRLVPYRRHRHPR